MHASIVSAAVRAAEVIGINLAGVDVICKDVTVELEKSGARINEINTTPGPAGHYEVLNQEAVQRIAVPVLKEMFDIK